MLGCFDAAAAAAAFEHVDRIARATVASGDGGGRTLGQVRADTALALLTGADPGPAGAGRGQGVISLTVGLSTLVGLDDDHGVLAGYGPVTAQVARQVAARFAHASRWRFSLHDDRGDGRLLCDGPLSRAAVAELVTGLCRWVADDTGRHPVDASAGPAGRAHRDPTQVQKIFVRARDGHCQFPGCRVPARRCDIDHRVAWQDGGATIVSNLHCLCRTHHRFKHLHQLDYETTVAGIVWNLPNTRRYLKQHQPTPGIGRHRHQSGFGGVIVELAGYTHTSGPSPHLRQ